MSGFSAVGDCLLSEEKDRPSLQKHCVLVAQRLPSNPRRCSRARKEQAQRQTSAVRKSFSGEVPRI